MLRGTDVDEVVEPKRQGLSIRAISRLTGDDRKTIRRYLASQMSRPVYGPGPPKKALPAPVKCVNIRSNTSLVACGRVSSLDEDDCREKI